MWLHKGSVYRELGRYSEAIQSYDKALEIDSKNADAWYNKGSALYSLEKFKEAIECYDNTLELDPNFVDAWNDMAYDVAYNLDRLPDNIQNLLFKLADNKDADSSVAYAVAANFDKLPEDARKELLIKI